MWKQLDPNKRLEENLEDFFVYTLGFQDALEWHIGELKRIHEESNNREEQASMPKLPLTLSEKIVKELEAIEEETGYSKSKLVDMACRIGLKNVREFLTQYSEGGEVEGTQP